MAHLGFFLCVLASLVSSSLAQKCHVSVFGIVLVDHVLSSFRDEDIHACYEKCKEKIGCMSINFYQVNLMCELNNRSITAKPSKKRDSSIGVYFEKTEPDAIGSHEELPGESCIEIKNSTHSPSSGVYWIKHAHQTNKTYCNISTGVADPCGILPCKNNGTCKILDEVTYKCTCVASFYGKNCQTKGHTMQSNILKTPKQYDLLDEWLAPVGKPRRWETCYHSKNDGWAASTFHTKCDNAGPTITIIKVNKYIFGGYTGASWDSSTRYMKSDNSFIFSFVNRDNLKPFKTNVVNDYAIYANAEYLPTFGRGWDIHLSNNAGNNMQSHTNFGSSYQLQGYPHGSSQAKNLLAGEWMFKPEEVEVFKQVGG